MDRSWAVGMTVITIVVLTAATGPVGLLTIPEESATDSLGEGNATITVVSMPETLTLEQGRYGNDAYHLRVPDARVDVRKLAGNPILNYNLEIDGLGKSGSSVHFLGEGGEGQRSLSYEGGPIAQSEITQDSYEARLALVLRTNGTERVIYNQSATVEVQR